MRKSVQTSLIAVFAALHAVLYFVSFGLWRNWAVYIEAIEGIILGPQAGFLAALLGSSVARTIRPDAFWMFGVVAEPTGVLAAGFLARGKWKPVVAAYGIMLSAYFVHPLGRQLPLWTILDVLLAIPLTYPAAKLNNSLFGSDLKRMSISMVLISFVCIATDALVRVFLLVPCGLYGLFFEGFGSVQSAFIAGAADSFIEDIIVALVAFLAGVPLLVATSRLNLFPEKNHRKKWSAKPSS